MIKTKINENLIIIKNKKNLKATFRKISVKFDIEIYLTFVLKKKQRF